MKAVGKMCLAGRQFYLLTAVRVVWRTCTALSTEHMSLQCIVVFLSPFEANASLFAAN